MSNLSPNRVYPQLSSKVVLSPGPEEVIVLVVQYECGLHFPCSEFIQEVLSSFNCEIHHLSTRLLVVRLVEGNDPFERLCSPTLGQGRQHVPALQWDEDRDLLWERCWGNYLP
jgi:hypothetical protein